MSAVAAVDERAGGWQVRVSGEIDIATAPELQRALDDALAASPAGVVADLSAVEFVDVIGLHVLLSAARSGRFAVANPSAAVRRLLELTGCDLPMIRFTPAATDPHANDGRRGGSSRSR